jgi:hypothetical protein
MTTDFVTCYDMIDDTPDYTLNAGYRTQRKNKITGDAVVVYRAADQGIEDEERWMVMCEGHNEFVGTATLRLAISAAREPDQWCSACQEATA